LYRSETGVGPFETGYAANAEEAEKTRSPGTSRSDNVNEGDESDDEDAPMKPKLDPMYY
jgi:hypothetical protein